MLFRKFLPAIIILPVCLFSSCDNVVDSPSGSVTGKLLSYNHSPIENLKVTIQEQSVMTSADGSFTLNNISYPYDVIITDSANRKASIFKDINVNNIELPLKEYGGAGYHADINVQIADSRLQIGKKWKVIFTDREFINGYTELSGINPSANIFLDMNKNITSGILIAISFIRDNNGNITSYENFGSYHVYNIQSGNTYNYTFDSLSTSLNPGEQNVSASLSVTPAPYSTEYFLSFGTKNKPVNYGYTFSYLSGIYINLKIPTGLPLPFTTVILNNTVSNSGNSYQEFTVNPNIFNVLTINTPPVPISPADGAENVNNQTPFSFNSGTGNGIYEIELINNSRFSRYKIITSQQDFTLEGLDKLGFGNINNNIFDWNVSKTGPANSMDDFVTNYFNQQNHFSSESTYRRFLTEP